MQMMMRGEKKRANVLSADARSVSNDVGRATLGSLSILRALWRLTLVFTFAFAHLQTVQKIMRLQTPSTEHPFFFFFLYFL